MTRQDVTLILLVILLFLLFSFILGFGLFLTAIHAEYDMSLSPRERVNKICDHAFGEAPSYCYTEELREYYARRLG